MAGIQKYSSVLFAQKKPCRQARALSNLRLATPSAATMRIIERKASSTVVALTIYMHVSMSGLQYVSYSLKGVRRKARYLGSGPIRCSRLGLGGFPEKTDCSLPTTKRTRQCLIRVIGKPSPFTPGSRFEQIFDFHVRGRFHVLRITGGR